MGVQVPGGALVNNPSATCLGRVPWLLCLAIFVEDGYYSGDLLTEGGDQVQRRFSYYMGGRGQVLGVTLGVGYMRDGVAVEWSGLVCGG